MLIFHTKAALQHFISQEKYRKTIGFVPTMGALHEGHLSLIRTALEENDIVVCSIFVNPIQFNNAEDFAKYPITFEADCEKLKGAGCTALFAPDVNEMYPHPVAMKLDFGDLENVMEGAKRPGHFQGVGIVVAKLFHLVMPDVAYFGQKDLQQCLVVKRLVRDFSFPLELKIHHIIREKDGLAMSSRNVRLTESQRKAAPAIYQTLKTIEELLQKDIPFLELKETAELMIGLQNEMKLEYFEIADAQTLQLLTDDDDLRSEYALCIAVFMGDVRLIDNLIVSR